MEKKGQVKASFEVSCGMCRKVQPLEGSIKNTANQKARQLGWKLTSTHGWLCPKCVEKQTATLKELLK